MRLLALDTATDLCSAALWIDGEVRTREALAPRAHGELILPMVEELLAGASLSLGALDAIAFGRGPGAFTGLRLAAGIAQGLALSVQLPLLPVSDLRAVAAQALAAQAPAASAPATPPRRALVCQDARMEEVYWACFERGVGALHLVGDEAVAAPLAVGLPASWIGTADAGGIVAAGSGLAAYPLLRVRLAAAVSAWLPDLYPRAREIAELAAEDGLACAVAPEVALPVYLRDRVTAPAAAAPAAPAAQAAQAAQAALTVQAAPTSRN
ncbi:MAG TPA: tRNA (adenosine(37)-N6)-threonylcarbamoyltransferase complex dimerization subunit type 1 TsaB [Steroidobacteraceae bacterium]|jgi:tRNA threonylcarbamoyladenosine biosynthesis protein TsaB|nr:tRNA (adenosine(37)-N6)-threonylcarbamoyltransferase complex dimerization subunit type 1 TsaB [Steroidobacteraceae bacterium]